MGKRDLEHLLVVADQADDLVGPDSFLGFNREIESAQGCRAAVDQVTQENQLAAGAGGALEIRGRGEERIEQIIRAVDVTDQEQFFPGRRGKRESEGFGSDVHRTFGRNPLALATGRNAAFLGLEISIAVCFLEQAAVLVGNSLYHPGRSGDIE
jgi:hypothetical protein